MASTDRGSSLETETCDQICDQPKWAGQGFQRGFLVAGGIAIAAAVVGGIATPKPKSTPTADDIALAEAEAGLTE